MRYLAQTQLNNIYKCVCSSLLHAERYKLAKYENMKNYSKLFQIRRMFNKADKNKDGKLTPEEWRQVLNASGVPTTMWVWFFSFKIKKCKYCFSCSFSFSTFYKNNMQSYKVWNKFFIDQPQYVSMKKYFHCDTLKACAAFCSTLYIFPFSSSSRDDVLVHNNVVISSTSASRNLHYFRLLSLQLWSGNSVHIPPSHTMLFTAK